MKLKHKIEYALLRSAVFCINLLPLSIINTLTLVIARIVWVFFPFRLPVAYENISTVFPDMTHAKKMRLLKNAYRHFLHAAGLIFK